MARILALAAPRTPHSTGLDVLRVLIVSGCAIALIFAKAPLPF